MCILKLDPDIYTEHCLAIIILEPSSCIHTACVPLHGHGCPLTLLICRFYPPHVGVKVVPQVVILHTTDVVSIMI